MDNNERKKLHQSLKYFQNDYKPQQNPFSPKIKEELHGKWCATTDEIIHQLNHIFGQSVSILCPIHAEQDKEFGNPQNLQAIHCLQLIEDLTQQERGRPIIILWRTNKDIQTRQNMRAGQHWQLYVILPSLYITFQGKNINTNVPFLYFKDTLNKRSKPCWLLIKLFKASESNLNIGGWFPQLQVVNCNSHHCAHQRHNDSGFWLLYFSIMFVLEGNAQFCQLQSISIPKGRNLRAIFKTIGSEEPEQKEQFKAHSNKTIDNAHIVKQFLRQMLVEKINSFNQNSAKNIGKINALSLEQLIRIVDSDAFASEQSKLSDISNQINQKQQLEACFMGGIISSAIEDIVKTESLQLKYKLKHLDWHSLIGLIKSDFYVDKSLFLQKILRTSPVYISRPKGWGKTMLFEMASMFFDKTDPQYNINQTKPIQIFKGGNYQNHHFKRLKIADKEETMNQFGKWPVIKISFIVDADFSCFYERFLLPIRNQYRRHQSNLMPFLKEQKSITDQVKYQLYQKILRNDKLNLEEAIESLCMLAQLLYRRQKKQVIVLIDNVDIFINKAEGNQDLLKDIQKFQKGWLQCCIQNTQIIKTALLFGNMGNEVIHSIVNQNYTAIDHSQTSLFLDDFGFTEDQMDELCQRVIRNQDWMAQKKAIQKWYNGFEVNGLALYNPSLITRYFVKCNQNNGPVDYESVYIEEENMDLINKLLKKYTFHWTKELQILLAEEETIFIKPIYWNINKIDSFNHFCYLLVKQGYLLPRKKEEGKMIYKITNNHIKRKLLVTIYLNLLCFEDGNGEIQLVKTFNKIISVLQDAKEFQAEVQLLCARIPKDKNINEAYFNSIFGSMNQFSCLFSMQSMSHRTFFEKSTDRQNRIDNLFIPIPGRSATVIIHEYKAIRLSSGQSLDKVIQDAIWQILLKGYLSVPVSIKKRQEKSWNEVISRAVVYYIQANHWHVAVRQFIHTFEQAEDLVNQFKGKQKYNQGQKQSFLKQRGFQKIYDFLQSNYSVKQRLPLPKIQPIPTPVLQLKQKSSKKQQNIEQRRQSNHKEIVRNDHQSYFRQKREQLSAKFPDNKEKPDMKKDPQYDE